MTVEILHEREPDGSCTVRVFVDGNETGFAYVSVDPGAGHTVSDWDEATAHQADPARGYSESFRVAVTAAYAAGRKSKYVEEEGNR